MSPGPLLASSAVRFSGNLSKNSGDTTPEIQVHPLSSETMGDGDNADTTIVHTKIQTQTAPDSIDTRAATRAGTGLTQYNPTVVATGKEGTNLCTVAFITAISKLRQPTTI